MAECIGRMIAEHAYFQDREEQRGIFRLDQDALKRAVPWALCRAKNGCGKTVVLAGHLDTVSVDAYGALREYACKPEQLMEKLSGENLPKDVREDLDSGAWLFGRGTADMKGGLSVLMNELFRQCEEENAEVNILFLAVPDEETYSLGMRKAASLLLDLKKRFDLDYQLMIMAESHIREDGAALYYDGTIGKLQVNIVVKGVPVHSRYYYTGMNPVLLAAEIAGELDGNADFSEQVGNEKTPPPSVMYFRDTKAGYDVTLPDSVDMAASVLTYRKSGEEVLRQLKTAVEGAIDRAMARIEAQYAAWSATIPLCSKKYAGVPKVLLYEQLMEMAEKSGGEGFAAYYDCCKRSIAEQIRGHKMNFNDATLELIHNVLSYLDITAPTVVLAIAPPLYPGFTNGDLPAEEKDFILGLPNEICRFSQEKCGQSAHFDHYFAGISDLSYVASNYDQAACLFVNSNMPLWGESYSVDFDSASQLQIPVLNVGPWGKGIHTKYERVNTHSLFCECPEIIHWIIETVGQHCTRERRICGEHTAIM